MEHGESSLTALINDAMMTGGVQMLAEKVLLVMGEVGLGLGVG